MIYPLQLHHLMMPNVIKLYTTYLTSICFNQTWTHLPTGVTQIIYSLNLSNVIQLDLNQFLEYLKVVPIVAIDGCEVSKNVSHHNLDIIFSADMSWHCHYEFIVGKAYKALGLLQRTFKCSNSILTKKFYINICQIVSIVLLPLWRPHQVQHIILLERVQRRASKFILNDYSTDYKSQLIKLNLLPLMYIYELMDILFFIKSLKASNIIVLILQNNYLSLSPPQILDLSVQSFAIVSPTTTTLPSIHIFQTL